VVFFDYNGNGMQDVNEPAIPGAVIEVGDLRATSGSAGIYALQGVPEGKQAVTVSAEGFRYVSLSLEAFQSIEQPVTVGVVGDTTLSFGLMQGFLTLPFACGTAFTRQSRLGLASVLDLDPREGFARASDPDIPPIWETSKAPWVIDNHLGLDFCIDERTEIRAAIPGVVTYAAANQYGGLEIWLCYGPWANYYNHNSRILVQKGETVARGQVIALSGNTGLSGEPHLHFSLSTCTTPPRFLDQYRDTTDPASVSYWTKDNDPQYPQ